MKAVDRLVKLRNALRAQGASPTAQVVADELEDVIAELTQNAGPLVHGREPEEAFLRIESNGTPCETFITHNGAKVAGVIEVEWGLAHDMTARVRLTARAHVDISHDAKPPRSRREEGARPDPTEAIVEGLLREDEVAVDA